MTMISILSCENVELRRLPLDYVDCVEWHNLLKVTER